jgi:hypothetical protein
MSSRLVRSELETEANGAGVSLCPCESQHSLSNDENILPCRHRVSMAQDRLSRDWLVQSVPSVRVRHTVLHFQSEPSAAVAIRHHREAITLRPVREQLALKSPITATVTEVPRLVFRS